MTLTEYQITIGISGVIGLPLPIVSGFLGGGMAVGVTTSGQLIYQYSGSGMMGVGAFAGVGAQVGISHSTCPTPPGRTTATTVHVEGNAGAGDAVGASGDFNSDGQGGNIPVPKLKVGFGAGVMGGVGVTSTTTIATPPLLGSPPPADEGNPTGQGFDGMP